MSDMQQGSTAIETRLFDPLAASAHDWAKFHAYRRVRVEEDYPGEPIVPDVDIERDLRRQDPLTESRRVLAVRDGEFVGNLALLCQDLSRFVRRRGAPRAGGFSVREKRTGADGRIHGAGHSLRRAQAGGPAFKHSEAFSFQVCDAADQVRDRPLLERHRRQRRRGERLRQWCKDKWGINWQITPAVLIKGVTNPDPAVAKRAFDAMMTMKKIDIAAIEAAACAADLGGGPVRALALVLLQEALAQADGFRRDLDQLVVGDEFHRVFQRQADRRHEVDRLVLARGADVGELLGADRVDRRGRCRGCGCRRSCPRTPARRG